MQQTNNTYPFYGPADIKRYLSGGMSAQEMHDMEKAALKDPFLADAIDGYRNANPALTEKHLNAIKAAIIGAAKKEETPVVELPRSSSQTPWWRWAAAACSLGIIASGIWWFTQKTNSGAQSLADANTLQTAHQNQSKQNIGDTSVKTENELVSIAQPQIKPEDVLENNNIKDVDKTTGANIKATEPTSSTLKKQETATPDLAPATASELQPITEPQLNNQPVASNAPKAFMQRKTIPNNTLSANSTIYKPQNREGIASINAMRELPQHDSNTELNLEKNSVKNYKSINNKINTGTIKTSQTEEMAILHYADTRKKTSAQLKDAQKAQDLAASTNEVIYPEEGWGNFYESLRNNLGVNASKSTKTLQIKFTVDDNGDPVDFEVVESPDAIMTKKAIEYIKKVKWKNFKLDKNALVKIEVN